MDKHDEWTDRIVDTFFEGNTREFMKGYVRRYLVTAASEATMAERARCARICREMPLELEDHKYPSPRERWLMRVAETGCRGAFADAIESGEDIATAISKETD